MAKRMIRGYYKIRTADGGWRVGHLFAGQTVKLAEGEYLEQISAGTPLRLDQRDLPMYMVASAPAIVIFEPGQIMRTFQVRKLKVGRD